MNILLLGHEGYLGRGLHLYLGQRHHVVGWDKNEDLFSLNAKLLIDHKVDAIINLAVAADRAGATYQLDAPTDRVNVGGARHLAQVLKGTDIMWFQMSTREVFGTP